MILVSFKINYKLCFIINGKDITSNVESKLKNKYVKHNII
jgi:hypothetical protein